MEIECNDNNILYTCEKCDFVTTYKSNFTKHLNSLRHKKKNGDENITKQYECSYCDYLTIHKGHYDEHLQSNAHILKKKMMMKNVKQNQCFHCKEFFNSYKSYWRHKKICNLNSNTSVIDGKNSDSDSDSDDDNVLMEVITNLRKEMDELKKSKVVDESQKRDDVIVEILKTNKELQNCMLQTVTEVKTIVQNSGTNNTQGTMNNNSHNTNTNNTNTLNQNKTFNMNFFLNEHCKNAIDIGDFIKNLDYSKENMIENRSMNYYERISNQFKEGFENCKVENRPIHCSDSKRNKMYIKDNGEWISGKDSEKRIKQIVVGMGIANMDTFRNWVTDNPACLSLDTPAFKLYMCILRNILGPTSDKEEEKFVNKVINTIVDETVIDKEKYAMC